MGTASYLYKAIEYNSLDGARAAVPSPLTRDKKRMEAWCNHAPEVPCHRVDSPAMEDQSRHSRWQEPAQAGLGECGPAHARHRRYATEMHGCNRHQQNIDPLSIWNESGSMLYQARARLHWRGNSSRCVSQDVNGHQPASRSLKRSMVKLCASSCAALAWCY